MDLGRRNGLIWRFAHCEYDESKRQLWVKGKLANLQYKPLEVLFALLKARENTLSKDQLLGQVWEGDADDPSLKTAVNRLRDAFGDTDRDSILKTLHGFGYKLVVPVQARPSAENVQSELRLSPGEMVPGYEHWRLLRPLGKSKPQAVWLAQHLTTSETHVFKFAMDGVRLQALQREVTLFRLLGHSVSDVSSFVPIFNWRFTSQPFFIETEYAGQNLAEWAAARRAEGTLSRGDCLQVMADLAASVAAAHSVGVLHNDLKPSNVLIEQSQGTSTLRVRVANFGIASIREPWRLSDLDISSHGFDDEQAAAGSRLYQAPEVRPGSPPTTAADIYALGIMLFQILCGDFHDTPSPGWEQRIDDSLLQEDVRDTANLDPTLRIKSAADLSSRLRRLEERRHERRKQERALCLAQEATHMMARSRMRRPWILFAMAALVVGFCASLVFYLRAAQERDLANSRAIVLAAMNDFLSEDLLTQSNPLATSSHSGHANQETLLEAVSKALPQIDRRFRNAPEIAGRLHQTIAAALDARTEFSLSAAEFEVAAQRFRQAEGPLSQNAIIAELRRENVERRSGQREAIHQADSELIEQEHLLSRIHDMTPELQGWQAFAQSGKLLEGSHPAEALSLLFAAVQRGEGTAGFGSELLFSLKARIAAVYLQEGNGVDAERQVRQTMGEIATLRGADSPELFEPELILEEALFIEGRYQDAIGQGLQNNERYAKVLGPDNTLTLAALETSARSEGALREYGIAIAHELDLIATERQLPARAPAENSLAIAASLECHSGHFASGIGHAREVIRESSVAPPLTGPANRGAYVLAECLIAREEDAGVRTAGALDEAGRLLEGIDVGVITVGPGNLIYEGDVHLAQARLARLRGQYDVARQHKAKAMPFFNKPGADPYEQAALNRFD